MLHAMLRMRMGFTPVVYIRLHIWASICAVLAADAIATDEVNSLRSRSAMGTVAQCNDTWLAKILRCRFLTKADVRGVAGEPPSATS